MVMNTLTEFSKCLQFIVAKKVLEIIRKIRTEQRTSEERRLKS